MQNFSPTGLADISRNSAVHQLSQNEARVLHSLVRWPNLSDQAIHSEIGMKKSTFSSIKARLREHDYYRRYYIPNFPLINIVSIKVYKFGDVRIGT